MLNHRKRRWVLFLYICVIILFCTAPILLSPFALYMLNEMIIYGLFAYGFYLLFSLAGYVSFGQAAYFAMGAYSVALIYKHVTPTIWLPFLTAIAVTAIVGAILGFLCVRLGHLYFAFLTLAFAQMIYAIIFQWRSFTGGDDGIPGVSRGIIDIYFMRIDLEPPMNFYYFSLVIFILLLILLRKLANSSYGLTLRSIRENIERTNFIGINPKRYVLGAFVISSVYCGIAGALHASLTKMAYPELSYWSTSGEPIMMSLIGGIYTFSGPLIGSVIYILLKTYLMTMIGNWILALGVILLTIVLFFRRGVMGLIEQKLGAKL